MVTAVGQSAAGGVHGFPAALTSFIGRAGPVREVAGLLAGHRLVTVTGPGGSGKTRLASEVAKRVADRFADGVWLVELAPLQDPALAAAVVATALGVREQPGEPAAGALARVLARQQLLLVLDNCEHVVGAAAALCAGLLSACDDVRILATSREPLAVAGEARYRLAPLALPDLDDLAGVARAEAVELFADRARNADAHFALDDRSAPAVARLVTRLDGMPLAIELAAARVEALGVTQLLDRLDDRFALLAGGDRLAPSRQQSLAATVEWSYQLLDETGRRVFRALSMFPGPFTLEGAEAVAGPGAGAAVLHLVDCSLLVPPRAGTDGRSRYGMLETLRSYGSAQLEQAGEQDGAAAALAGWALCMAEEATVGLETSAGELDAARWLDAEDAATRQVLAWAIAHDTATAVRLAAALGWWWFLRGRLAGAYPLLREVAERAEPGSDGWCTAQFWLGWTALFSADLAGALGHFTVLRDAVADRPPSRALADALAGRSIALQSMGRIAEAVGDARRALAVAREIGYPVGELLALADLSFAASFAGDHDDAVRLAWQAAQVTAGVPGSLARSCSQALDRRADRGRGPSRGRAGQRGGAGPGPGGGRPVEPVGPAAADGGPGPAGGPHRRRRGAPAGRTPARRADRQLGRPGQRPVPLRDPVRRDRAPRRGPHGLGRERRALAARGIRRSALVHAPPGGTAARGPASARTRPGAGGRGTRRGDEPGHRGGVRPDAHRPRPAGRGTGTGRSSAPGNASWSPWSRRAAPTRRSPPSCTSASARSARTWTGSGTRPAAAAAPT